MPAEQRRPRFSSEYLHNSKTVGEGIYRNCRCFGEHPWWLYNWQITSYVWISRFWCNLWKAQLGGHSSYYHYTFAKTFSAILDVLVPEELLVLLAWVQDSKLPFLEKARKRVRLLKDAGRPDLCPGLQDLFMHISVHCLEYSGEGWTPVLYLGSVLANASV